jgi:hypothetical protein
MIDYSDRLGQHGNADNNWFDHLIESWKMTDGDRLPALEMADIGRRLVHWMKVDRPEIDAAIFSEMEDALVDGAIPLEEVRGFVLEVLDGMRDELFIWRRTDVKGFELAHARLCQMMGKETRQIWLPFWAAIQLPEEA